MIPFHQSGLQLVGYVFGQTVILHTKGRAGVCQITQHFRAFDLVFLQPLFQKLLARPCFFFVRGDRVQVTRICSVGLDSKMPKYCNRGAVWPPAESAGLFLGSSEYPSVCGQQPLRYGMDNGKRTKRQMSIQVFYIRGFSKLPTKEQ